METMKGVVVTAPGKVCIRDDIPRPVCGDYEALVQVKYCGFCNGTDLHIVDGTMTKEAGLGEYPTILGHEGSGVVVEVGKKVRHIKVGDCFVHTNLYPNVGNGYTRTYGGMADYGLVADHQAMAEDGYQPDDMPFMNPQYPRYGKFGKIPSDFSLEGAAALLSMSECLSMAENAGVDSSKKVLIYGDGPMGLGIATYCRALGAKKVVIAGHHQNRLDLAKKIANVDRTIDSSKITMAEALDGELFDIVMDVAGFTSVLLEGSQFLYPFGRVCSVGVLSSNDLTMNVQALKNNTMLQMLNLPYQEYKAMEKNVRLIQEGKVRMTDFYSHVVDRDHIQEAIDLVRSREALKVIVKIND